MVWRDVPWCGAVLSVVARPWPIGEHALSASAVGPEWFPQRQGGFHNASPQRGISHQRAFSKHGRCYKNRLSSPPAPWPWRRTASIINNLALVGVARVGSGCQRRTSTLRSCMLLFIRVGMRAGVRAWVCVGYTLVSCALGLERGGLAACMSDVFPSGRQQCVDFRFQMLGIKVVRHNSW